MSTALEPEIVEVVDPRTRRAERLRRLLTRDRITALAIGLCAYVLGLWNIAGSPTFQDDEGTYAAQAAAVLEGDLAPYTYWYDHPPLGWIQLAIGGWLPYLLGIGGSDLAAFRTVMPIAFAASAALVYLILRRVRVRTAFAVLASVVFALSPLSLELGRQVFLDNVATPWVLLAVYAALSPRTALWHHVGSGLFFAVAVLTKLTSAIFGPAIMLAMLGRDGWRGRSFSIVGFLTVGGLVLALFPVMAILRGELLSDPNRVSLQDALAYQFLSRSGSGWLWEEGSHRGGLVASWVAQDPLLLLAGVAAALACAFAQRTRWITVAIAGFALPIVASQGYLPAMYVIGVLPFLALAMGAGLDLAWRAGEKALDARAPAIREGFGTVIATAVAVALIAVPAVRFVERAPEVLAGDANGDWKRTLAWVTEHVPRDEVVLVPYSMWLDLDTAGWNDPWTLIVLEKVDLDSQFDVEHPDGWTEIRWIVEGPTVRPNIEHLGLETAGRALDAAEPVVTFGEWTVHAVVPPTPPQPGATSPAP
ncbi:hypothetical protein ARHIZOSPH14_01450 [Agromyces rhizosphaerae]|uniref:Glycosyltransferase RgtA/B/C/D-like domain-containing protein n=1 Tax=Agromyces rhizosphaerae TaxID=88374 RepID=A0A9W6CP17_9MICO|nr:glycosyltransferase family 39 protein [Agromyces rhizosphaerae]GLI25903.1 hypothetical protein ARHIZOSPH14_01450 [Agromyces rhizosphaerae]